jgi:hypothetical protein
MTPPDPLDDFKREVDRRFGEQDRRMTDRFNDFDRRLAAVDALPAQLSAVAAQLTALSAQVLRHREDTTKGFDQLRADLAGDTGRVESAVNAVRQNFNAFLTGLLIAVIAGIVCVVIFL